MNVVRRMLILSGGDKRGVLKLERIGSKISGQLNVYGDDLRGLLYIGNGGDILPPVIIGGSEFTVYDAPDLSETVEAVFARDGRIVMGGSNRGEANAAKLYADALLKFPENREPAQTSPTEISIDGGEEPAKDVKAAEEPAEKDENSDAASKKKGGAESIFENGTVLVNDIVKYSTEYPFYEAVKLQLEELFSSYPAEEQLEKSIPESRWAHIDYDEEYYVVGVISEENQPRYICYGVPADKNIMPVCDINENCEWLSLDADTPDLGYYMMYQDAVTGETLVKG